MHCFGVVGVAGQWVADLHQFPEKVADETGGLVELVFDPFDLTKLAVRYGGRSFGAVIAFYRPPLPSQGPPGQCGAAPGPTGSTICA